jgi:hypothetical protein
MVHTGFLNAYNAVADDILTTVQDQVQAYPGYSIVTTGQFAFFYVVYQLMYVLTNV